MNLLVLVALLLSSILLAFVTAKGMLSLIFHLMSGKGLGFRVRGKGPGDLAPDFSAVPR